MQDRHTTLVHANLLHQPGPDDSQEFREVQPAGNPQTARYHSRRAYPIQPAGCV